MPDILAPYWIVSGCAILAGIVIIISAFSGLVSKVTTNQSIVVDLRPEDPWKNREMMFYFLVVMAMFLCVSCMGTVFSNYLYIYGMCR